jgi:hypothetical protein
MSDLFNGIEVQTDRFLTETVLSLREHSTNRFIEYEKKDEWWLVKYGFAKYVTIPSKQMYMVEVPLSIIENISAMMDNRKPRTKKVFIMHPETWEVVKRQLEKQIEIRERYFSIPPPQLTKFQI